MTLLGEAGENLTSLSLPSEPLLGVPLAGATQDPEDRKQLAEEPQVACQERGQVGGNTGGLERRDVLRASDDVKHLDF